MTYLMIDHRQAHGSSPGTRIKDNEIFILINLYYSKSI